MGHGHCFQLAFLPRANQLEKEIRTLRQQLNRSSEINPEEYARLQEAERQMEEASAKKVAAVAAERDEAPAQVLQLRKDRLLERAFVQAEGPQRRRQARDVL